MDRDTHVNNASETQEDHLVSFEEFLANAGAFFDEAATGVRITVERGGRVFRLASVRHRGKRSKRHFSKDDVLWDIVGMLDTGGPGDIAENKYTYLADAYAETHEADGGSEGQAPQVGEKKNSQAERQ